MKKKPTDLEAVAGRVRSARSLVRMSRKDFCEKHGLNQYTVQSWEAGRYLIRQSNLKTFCKALEAEGVHCAPVWLSTGEGGGPKLVEGHRISVPDTVSVSQEDEFLQIEMAAFRSTHKIAKIEVVITRVPDQAMRPFYEEGDYVGGRLLVGEDFRRLNGKICIVKTSANNSVVRRLCSDGKRIILVPLQPDEEVSIFDTVLSAAEVIWHRRVPQ